MGVEDEQKWGTTPPISRALPTEAELRQNESLLQELRSRNNFESAEETEKRKQVIAHMQKVTEEFVRQVSRGKGMNETAIEASGGKVATFGSYRLGVYGPGSDIDTLIVAPKHVNRDDFFAHFARILKSMSPAGAIQSETSVADAYVPIIKLEYLGISIDLIFTSLAQDTVPDNINLKDKTLLRGMNQTDLRCINGTRVTDEILSLIPQVKSFRFALRAVKLWAQKRALYAAIYGYPGGVAWAMMVARICQLYPMACGAVIVSKFFHLMSIWTWPTPIMLKEFEDGPLQVQVWNPKLYRTDGLHLMPVITPAYPAMCATHNVSLSTREIVVRELKRANTITDAIFAGTKQWGDLFQKHTFFTEGYKYYLSIVSGSRTKEAQNIWSGLVESKVRKLVVGIEKSDTGVQLAHPFNKGFKRIHQCSTEEEVDKVFQGDLSFQVSKEEYEALENSADATDKDADDTSSKNGGKTVLYTTTFYVGLELKAGLTKKLDISMPVADFRRECAMWRQFDEKLNSLRIVHARNYALPPDVFEEGEKRPEPSKSKKKSSNGPSKKASKSTLDSASTEAPTPESRKRTAPEDTTPVLSHKKPNLSATDSMNGVKPSLESEVRLP
ncbi:Poly(A) polymerase [Microthyrium microscopicum]|uniref:Poly(A) polymerase n=1 Tax=Microthyrium microscopicum TaxID=703497 RepID=A0A6A6U106_9PEZI|nr:Poly(A) polymerase [Microthyrium microscopicum]